MISDEESARGYVASLCGTDSMQRLDRFAAMLHAENERQNLVAAATLPRLWQRHIADSAQLLRFPPAEPSGPWLDLGTGAGFPGLVIAAMRPTWSVRLVESRRKRIDWLVECCRQLGLERCEVLCQRLEKVESFAASVISARAFAPLGQLFDLSARFSTAATLWLLPKGRQAALELAQLPKTRGSRFHVEHSLTDSGAGIIVGGGGTRVTGSV